MARGQKSKWIWPNGGNISVLFKCVTWARRKSSFHQINGMFSNLACTPAPLPCRSELVEGYCLTARCSIPNDCIYEAVLLPNKVSLHGLSFLHNKMNDSADVASISKERHFWVLASYRQQPSPSLYSIDIWPVGNSRLTQRETNHCIARCASVLARSYLAGGSPERLVIDLFAQHQRFVVCCQWENKKYPENKFEHAKDFWNQSFWWN